MQAPADTVIYEKANGDGSYYAVQAVPDTKKKTLYIVTAFIGKSGYKNTEGTQPTNADSPGATPAAESAMASCTSISDSVAGVNGEKVHRILTPDGSVFELNTREAEPTPGGGVTENGSLATPINSASNTSIFETLPSVNVENEIRWRSWPGSQTTYINKKVGA